MIAHNWMVVIVYILILAVLTPILGTYIYAIFSGQRTFIHPALSWLENFFYRAASIDPTNEMSWVEYARALLWTNFLGFLLIFLLFSLQGFLPLNPQEFPGVAWPLAFNAGASFSTNTDWQSYAGETTLSYFTQMLGITVQNFMSAATGLSVAMALIRGITRANSPTIGNFWSDLVRGVVYLLLPLSIILCVALISEGVIQNLNPYLTISTLEDWQQTIAFGPVASQVAIKQLGTNGGGFFNVNSAHPYENPTVFTNWLEMIALAAFPTALTYTYGLMSKSSKQAWLLVMVMLLIWGCGVALAIYAQNAPNPIFDETPILEGIETRFGVTNSILWSTMTTASANGSVNAMISSLAPLAGGISLFNIMLSEIAFGGVGVGLCSILMFTLLTVFLCGLMVGRTPEYMGKKIEKREMKWIVVAVLMPGVLTLIGAGISAVNPTALESLGNKGPHGLTEMLYAFASAVGNNGSAFAGLNANTNYYNISLGIAMLIGRLSVIIPSLGIAGLLAEKRAIPPSQGTFSTDTFLFFILLVSVIIIVGALTFFPALSLGPIVEHILMLKGQTF